MALCNITGTVYLPSGELARSARVIFSRADKSVRAEYLGAVIPDDTITQTNSAGEIDVSLLTGRYVLFTGRYSGGAIVPDAETADISDILTIVTPDIPVPAWLEQALAARDSAVDAATDAADSAAEAAASAADAASSVDAAFLSADVYQTISAGRSAVADGGQFKVVSGEDIVQYRRDSSTTQTEMARYPTALALANTVDSLSENSLMARTGQPIAGANLANGTYVLNQQAQSDSDLYRVDVWSLSAATIQVRRFTPAGQVGPSVMVPLDSGYNSVSVTMPLLQGEYIGIYTPGNSLCATGSTTADNVGYRRTLGDTNVFPTSALVTSNRIEVRFSVRERIVTKDTFSEIQNESAVASQKADSALSAIEDIATSALSAVETRASTAAYTTGNFGGWAGTMLLPGVEVDTVITAIELQGLRIAAGGTKVRLSVYSRPDGETSAPPTNCTLVFTQDYPLGDIGITAGDANVKSAIFNFPSSYVKGASDHLAWRVEALDVSDAKVNIGMGYLIDPDATGSERGWYYANLTTTSYTVMPSPNKIAGVLFRQRFVLNDQGGGVVLSASDASIDVSGTNISVSGTVDYVTGEQVSFSGTLPVALAASGQERMDLIVLDRSTLSLSMVVGTSRTAQLDSLEWQAAVPSNALLIGRARVGSTAVQAVSVADWKGVVRNNSSAAMAFHINRNRAILRGVFGKALRGEAIRLGGYGDSITALQAGTPGFEANGVTRDRIAENYLTHYPTDTKTLIQRFDTGDGAGMVHTRIGWNWDIKAAIDEIAGADVVSYFNYGIGGTNSQATTGNGLDPARIAFPLADDLDLVVIAFGMNERGQSYTYGNIVNIIGQFKAAGVACVVMGCPRPNANQSLSAWRVTNNALEAAAMDAGAAFVSTAAIADDQTIGGMGVPAEALASANTINNGNNHPGIYELNRYGTASVTQLGI